ncbi:mycothiol system anti-sigma-R factor [Ornithinimicrobium sp. W1679]|uniref:mycothiol system anti-sigma-R factor n=1 Tax=unclassified Ornithinimicrobium TaxID=2615080 RepID=UPI003CF400E7
MNHRHDERDDAQAVDCADVVLRLFEFVDNETGPVDQERIQEHLDECGSCLAEYERDLLIKALVRRACACEQAPAALRTQILTRITTTSVTVVRERRER